MKVAGFQPNFVGSTEKSDNLLKQLATGKKINSAADNPAALQIVNRLSAELDGYLRGAQNGQDGISLAQTAEAAFSGIGDATERIRELTIQAGNGALGQGDRQAIQNEINQLTGQIGDIASNTTFGGVDLLNSNSTIGITLDGSNTIGIDTKDVNTDLNGLGFNAIDVTTQAGAQAAVGVLDNVQDYLNTNRAELGAAQNRIDAGVRNIRTQYEQVAAARGRIEDTDFAQATSERIRNDILQQSQIAIQSQANLNRQQAINLLS